ncbi:MAG TPA: MFS transporter [Bacteroidales bacterium]|nr:MFS transporter [Bacteroidales bacterium]
MMTLTPDTQLTDNHGFTKKQKNELFSKINWRLMPLLFICYIIAYIDRINVGFAKLQLREVLGVDDRIFGSIYGIGAGLFFIGYFIFEVPSNLVLHRVGARIWIARIMIVWGCVTILTMFISSTFTFYLIRFLLGAAEAGFFPGVIFYLTFWYPEKERARTIALFSTGGVIAGIIGSPLSGTILDLHGKMGLDGWQWLFLLEGIPAVLMGIIILIMLPNGPGNAKWLGDNEKMWIHKRLKEEAELVKDETHFKLKGVLSSSRVWLLCLIYFLMTFGAYGFEMWLPSIITDFSGMSYTLVGFINAIPYVGAVILMLIIGTHSDKTGERRWHVATAALIAAVGFAFSTYFRNPFLSVAALTMAFAGLKSTMGPFWVLGTTFLSGSAAAGGIALINSVGNLGGFFGPTLVGIIRDRTGSTNIAFWIFGASLLLMAILVLTVKENKKKLQS